MIASNREHRMHARQALNGKWQAAMIVMLMLCLIGGQILNASITSFSGQDGLYDRKLVVKAGPIRSETYYVNGRIELDAGRSSNEPGLVPLSDRIVTASLLMTLALFLLRPVYEVGCARLGLRVMQGEEADMGVLRLGFKAYLRAWGVSIRAALGTMLAPLPLGIAGVLAFAFLPVDFALRLTVLVACMAAMVVFAVMRAFNYSAAYTLLALHPDMKAREITRESKRLMRGYCKQCFMLHLSFIGWNILCGIGATILSALCGLLPASLITLAVTELATALPLLPMGAYIHTSRAAFMLDLIEHGANATY